MSATSQGSDILLTPLQALQHNALQHKAMRHARRQQTCEGEYGMSATSKRSDILLTPLQALQHNALQTKQCDTHDSSKHVRKNME